MIGNGMDGKQQQGHKVTEPTMDDQHHDQDDQMHDDQMHDDGQGERVDEPTGGMTERENDDESPSKESPIESRTPQYSEIWWATVAAPTSRRCTASLSNGSGRCRKPCVPAMQVCTHHGGRAPQAKRKAQQRIAEAADRMARALLKMSTDENTPEHVKLKAITEALDRAGVNAKTSVEVEVSAKPFEQVLDGMAGQLEITSRSAYRRSVGTEDDQDGTGDGDADPLAGLTQPAHHDDEPIDAEVLSEHEYAARVAARPFVNVDHQADTHDDAERQRDGRTAPGIDTPDGSGVHWMAAGRPPVDIDQPMTVAEGAEIVADMRAQAAEQRRADLAAAREAGRAVIRQSQRALPRGRS